MGARKSYNPKNKGKLSYQPILTFIAETREYIYGDLHNGHRPSGKEIKAHLKKAIASLPAGVKQILGRDDSGFYCQEAIEAYEEDPRCQFVICAEKTDRLVEQLQKAALCLRNLAHGNMDRQRSIVVESRAYRL